MALMVPIATIVTIATMVLIAHLILALLAALAAGGLILAAPALVTGLTGARIRAGLGRRARTIALPRPHRGRLAGLRADIARAVLGDTRGPVGPGLVARRPAEVGIPRLRWLLLHAGGGRRSIAWLRLQQAEATLAALVVAGAIGLAWGLTPTASLLLAPPALLAGQRLPLLVLARRARARRARLRIELVTVLYGLAALVVRGRPVERALDRLALRPGDLAQEVAFARELHFDGTPMDEALEILAARCGSEEVRDAMSLVAAALGGAVALERAAAMFKDLADSISHAIDEGRKEELAYAILRFTGLGTILGLFIAGTTVLYPVLAQALRSLVPGGG